MISDWHSTAQNASTQLSTYSSHELRPGFWLYWGDRSRTLDLTATHSQSLLFIFRLDETWNSKTPSSQDVESCDRMILVRTKDFALGAALADATFQVVLAASIHALDELLAGDNTTGSERVRRYADGMEAGPIEFRLSSQARFSAESIRRCPFAGVCRGLALTARSLDLLAEFIGRLNRANEPTSAPHQLLHDSLSQVQAAAAQLRAHLEHPPSIDELAGIVGLSLSTLKRGFRQLYQTTPFGYLRARRMDHAKELLATGKSTVLEAASYVGYSNPSNFAAAFRKQFGVNPKTFQMAARC